MTESDIREKRKAANNIERYRAEAAQDGLKGYFRRHGCKSTLFREIRRCMRERYIKTLTNFGEAQELYELPTGDIVIDDHLLAYRVESFFKRLDQPGYGQAPGWYLAIQYKG